MESITLQMLELELGKYKKMDLQKKLDIAVNIFERIQETPFTSREESCFDNMDKISTLTGVNTIILREICKLEDVSKKFKEWSKEAEVSARMNILYATMKKYLQVSYTKDHEIPTKSALLSRFREKFRPEFQVIFNKYFSTIQVPGTQHSIMVEKPEIVMKRHQYLRKKMEFLKAGKVFVYIEDICFYRQQKSALKMCKPQNISTKRLVLAVSPELGYVGSIYCCRTVEANLRHWLEEKVIPMLTPECVLIFEDGFFGYDYDPPRSHSSKQDMIDWLRQKDIPYNTKSHRAELYGLIETYQKTYRELTKAEQILKVHGHTALCRGEGVVFEYFEPFWKILKEILDSKKGTRIVARTTKKQLPSIAIRVVSLIQKEYWQELQSILLDLEISAHRKDREMEEIIDKLMTYAASVELNPAESEFDDYCEAMGHEYIFNQ